MDRASLVRRAGQVMAIWHAFFVGVLVASIVMMGILEVTELMYHLTFYSLTIAAGGMMWIMYLSAPPTRRGFSKIMYSTVQWLSIIFTSILSLFLIAFGLVKQWNLWWDCKTASFWVWKADQLVCDSNDTWWFIALAIFSAVTMFITFIEIGILFASMMATMQFIGSLGSGVDYYHAIADDIYDEMHLPDEEANHPHGMPTNKNITEEGLRQRGVSQLF